MSGHGAKHVGLAVLCTDRGQHRATRLTTLNLAPGPGEGVLSHPASRYVVESHPRQYGRKGRSYSRFSYTFSCPRCPRDIRVDRDRWWAILQEAWRVRVTSLDVSRL